MAGGGEVQVKQDENSSQLVFVDPKIAGQLMTGFMSKHMGPGNYNEDNSGIGYRSDDGYMVGAYKNSLNKPSAYLAKEFTTDPYKLGPLGLQLGAVLGGATGYGRPVTPVVMPEILGSMDGSTLALGLVPPVKGVTPATLALQLRKKF